MKNATLNWNTKLLYFTDFYAGPDPLPKPNSTMIVRGSEMVDDLDLQVIYIDFSMDTITRLIEYAAANYPYGAQFSIKAGNARTYSLKKEIVASGGVRRTRCKRAEKPSTSITSHATTPLDKASSSTADDKEEKCKKPMTMVFSFPQICD